MTFTTDSIGMTGFNPDYLDPNGDIGDLAFLITAYQLQNYDLELRSDMAELKGLMEVKKAYRERLDRLNSAVKSAKKGKVLINADDVEKVDYSWSEKDGGLVEVPTGERLPVKDDKYYLYDKNGQQVYDEVVSSRELTDGMEVGRTIKVAVEGDEDFVRQKAETSSDTVVKCYVKKDDIQAEIERIQGKLDGLNSDGEIKLLGINRLLSKRNQAVQLASNVMSSSHQTAISIISNIK